MLVIRNLIKIVVLPMLFMAVFLPTCGLLSGVPDDARMHWLCAFGWTLVLWGLSDLTGKMARSLDEFPRNLAMLSVLIQPALLIYGLPLLSQGYVVAGRWYLLLAASVALRYTQSAFFFLLGGRTRSSSRQ